MMLAHGLRSADCLKHRGSYRFDAAVTRWAQVAPTVHWGADLSGFARWEGLLKEWISTACVVSMRGIIKPTGTPSR